MYVKISKLITEYSFVIFKPTACRNNLIIFTGLQSNMIRLS